MEIFLEPIYWPIYCALLLAVAAAFGGFKLVRSDRSRRSKLTIIMTIIAVVIILAAFIAHYMLVG